MKRNALSECALWRAESGAVADWPIMRHCDSVSVDEIRVWRACLDLHRVSVDRLAGLLSNEERDRAQRFRFQRDATRFVVSRAALRTGLACCLGVEPERIAIRYGAHGKPELATPFDRSGLQFNTSHTDGVALGAVTRVRRVGVDIERLRSLDDLDALTERVFAPAERQALRGLPPSQRLEGFFNCWTRKEAYVKAIGAGLGELLTGFSVSLVPGAPARLVHVDGDPEAPDRWSLAALEPAPGCVAAIAVEGRPARLECYTWVPAT